MGYSKEKASKTGHQHIIQNVLVQEFLSKCEKIGYDDIPDLEYETKQLYCKILTTKLALI